MMWECDELWSASALGGGGWLMFFGLIIGTLAVVLVVVFLVRETTRTTQAVGPTAAGVQSPSVTPPPDSPREILKRRYAAGEIDREEYLQRLSDL